ncbi:MAG: NADH-quinone oxidoreductase subunit NuoF, partial [bacterium]
KDEIAKHGLGEEIKVQNTLPGAIESDAIAFPGDRFEICPHGADGVTMVVYPEQVIYENVQLADVAFLVEEHLLKGRPVKRLMKLGDISQEAQQKIGPEREQTRVVLANVGVIDPENIDEYKRRDGYAALKKALTSMTPAEAAARVKRSGLRGRGGAGFPTGLKWESAAKTPADQRYIICNADEGEPGTFKDRLILEGDPHKLIEGILLGAYASGASKGYLYIRGEYALSIHRMRKAIADAYHCGLLGPKILDSGFSFDLEIKEGAGGYVCGDETALMESLEGKRGDPRIKPPYPTVVGLFGKPTVINNVETLANVPPIIAKGADWFRTLGSEKSPGSKIFTILGDVQFPGAVEAPMGTSLAEIIFGYGGGIKGGRKFKAALLGGAAGIYVTDTALPAKMDFDSPKEFSATLGSGAVLVMSEETSVVESLYAVLRFFEHESCGQCVPCRAGTKSLFDLIKKVRAGQGAREDLDRMIKVSEVLWSTSLCPLGQSLIMPVKSAIENFPDDFLSKVQ